MTTKSNASSEMTLDQSALDAVRSSLDQRCYYSQTWTHRDAIIKLLNGALATELVCVLRYKRHHFMASGASSPKIAEEFMVHANGKQGMLTALPNALCNSAANLTFRHRDLAGTQSRRLQRLQ